MCATDNRPAAKNNIMCALPYKRDANENFGEGRLYRLTYKLLRNVLFGGASRWKFQNRSNEFTVITHLGPKT